MTKKIEDAKKDADGAVDKANENKAKVQDKDKENTKKNAEDCVNCKKDKEACDNAACLSEELAGIKKRVDEYLKTEGPKEEEAKEEKKKA